MPGVVSNSTPLIHLAKIGLLELLPEEFGRVMIPPAVWRECVDEGPDRPDARLIAAANWLDVVTPDNSSLVRMLASELDQGESEAIALALKVGADTVLLDDADARAKARIYSFQIAGTVGLLLKAKLQRRIDRLDRTLEALQSSGFWLDRALKVRLLREAGESA